MRFYMEIVNDDNSVDNHSITAVTIHAAQPLLTNGFRHRYFFHLAAINDI